MNDDLDTFRDAIQTEVNTELGPGHIVTDYIVIAAARGYDTNGEPHISTFIESPSPHYATLGLLHTARLYLEQAELEGEE